MREPDLPFSFNIPSTTRQCLSLSSVLIADRGNEGVNEQETAGGGRKLMSRRAALVCLTTGTLHPLKKDIVCTCLLAPHNATV